MIREEEPTKPSTRVEHGGRRCRHLAANRGTEPAALTQLVRGELDWIVMKALEKDRSRRYETANAFAADVQRYLKDEPVEACPPSALYRFRKFARRHKRGLLTAAVVALVVVLTAAGSGGLIWRANQDLHQALDRERLTAYIQRIALAEREWAANNLGRMEQLLDDCPEDLRGWEWHYLKRLRYSTICRCATRAASIASRSAPTASTWPRSRRTALSDSGRRKPARNSGSGGLTTKVPTPSRLAPTAGSSPREAGIRRSRFGTWRRSFRARSTSQSSA